MTHGRNLTVPATLFATATAGAYRVKDRAGSIDDILKIRLLTGTRIDHDLHRIVVPDTAVAFHDVRPNVCRIRFVAAHTDIEVGVIKHHVADSLEVGQLCSSVLFEVADRVCRFPACVGQLAVDLRRRVGTHDLQRTLGPEVSGNL